MTAMLDPQEVADLYHSQEKALRVGEEALSRMKRVQKDLQHAETMQKELRRKMAAIEARP